MANERPWHKEALAIAVIYALTELKQRMPYFLNGDRRFLEDVLTAMYTRSPGLLDIDEDAAGKHYVLTGEGRLFRDRLVAMYDQAAQFEIFHRVNIDMQLPAESRHEQDPNLPHDALFDPRFAPQPDSADMRLAMMTFLNDVVVRASYQVPAFEPGLVVFLQGLAAGAAEAPGFWGDLGSGKIFADIEAVTASAYPWTNMAPDDRTEAERRMRILYAAGLIEATKRRGECCGTCGTALGMFDQDAAQQGRRLDACPNPGCGASLRPETATRQAVTPSGFVCPREGCATPIGRYDRACRGCGAVVDISLPAGTAEQETVPVTETTVVEEVHVAWDGYGTYVPVFFDPCDPLLIFERTTYGLVLPPIIAL